MGRFIVIALCLGAFIGFVSGFLLGVLQQEGRYQRIAVSKGYASFQVDSLTGETKFRWKELGK